MKKLLFYIVLWLSIWPSYCQNADSLMFKRIFNEALLRGEAYKRLGEMCKTIGPRLSGSDNAQRGIEWARMMLQSYKFDTVFTQPVLVPRWERSKKEEVWMYSPLLSAELKRGKFPPDFDCESFVEGLVKPLKSYKLNACALGGSVGSNGSIYAAVIAIRTDAELDSLGKLGLLKDKIVLFNRRFDESFLNTFQAYGSCVTQRVTGATRAAKYGALAVLVRSMSNRCDLHPHTGSIKYDEGVNKIPAAAVATSVADVLERLSRSDKEMRVLIQLGCKTYADRLQANIIAQTNGIVYPNKYIAFGGHFDSWDEGEGAHDDGAGCMHAFDALRILKAIGYQPRHNLRCVFWINEENGLRGGLKYAQLADSLHENHFAALESDRGGFTPRGFGIDSSLLPQVLKFKKWLDAYGIGTLETGGGGADIGPLKKINAKTAFVSFIPDPQRYFDIHHAETDVFENVNKRELEMGAAAIAAMIWILDQAE